MSRRHCFVASVFVLGGLATSSLFACSAAPGDNAGAEADAGDAAPGSEGGPIDPIDSGTNPRTDSATDTSRGEDSKPSDAGPSCVPKGGVDLPDDAFEDSNCDGIDGDKSAAIFVAPSGSDEAVGTIDAPVKTVQVAVTRATKDKKAVYLCNGTYTEAVVVTTSAVSLYGGYDCGSGWKRVFERAVLAPGSGVPLTIRDVADDMTVDRIELRAADATAPSGSSIAALVRNAASLTVRNSVLEAGRGADGAAPSPASAYAAPTPTGAPGESLKVVECTYGTTNTSPCLRGGNGGATLYAPGDPDMEQAGGVGGKGGHAENKLAITWETPGSAGRPSTLGGASLGIAWAGQPGKTGLAGSAGMSATQSFGSIADDGYVASNTGYPGTAGGAGGGGSGGSGGHGAPKTPGDFPSNFYSGGGGGAGGAGGAPGAGGNGGGGGGASLALLAIDARVTVTHSTLTTHAGGRGGVAGPGGDGQIGGAGGPGGSGTWPAAGDSAGLPGGSGGNGGKGGPGGAGGGGPSIAILQRGAKVSTDAITINLGTGGKGGRALSGVDGADGKTIEVFDPAAPTPPVGDAGPDAAGDSGI